jgi:rhodanese-related sulfurtransferase
MMKKMLVQALQAMVDGGTASQIIDVRSLSEFSSGHIPKAINIPLEQLSARQDDLDPHSTVILVCQSGHRAEIASNLLSTTFADTQVLEGGTAAWKSAGFSIVCSTRSSWSLERQVRLAAGLLILVSFGLAWTVSTAWVFVTAFVGVGLTFAGATDICGMGILLAAMPWNRRLATDNHASCSAPVSR